MSAFIEEADLPDMLSDTGKPVSWTPGVGDPVTRNGLVERHTAAIIDGVSLPVKEQVATVLVERSYFDGIKEGDTITVDGQARAVREVGLTMRSMLRIDLVLT